MTPADYKALALAHLDRCDDADMEALATEQPTADWFAELYTRWTSARQAFPGMSWEEFCELDVARNRKGKRGRPKRSAMATADEPLWRAARDADRLKALWASMHPETPRPYPPIHPHDLTAERHGVSRQLVDDRVNRPDDRRIDRIAAQKEAIYRRRS